MPRYERRTLLSSPAEHAFAWHLHPGAFERLIPPWESVEVVERQGGPADGGRTVLRVGVGPLRLRWVAQHEDFLAGVQFCDVQTRGPFAAWRHVHRVEPASDSTSWLIDQVDYRVPGGWLGQVLAGRSIAMKLEKMFEYRHCVTGEDLSEQQRLAESRLNTIAITGASGLVGQALTAYLSSGGKTCLPITRTAAGAAGDPQTIGWNLDAGQVEAAKLAGVDAVVHLAGENIAGGRWNEAKKRRIRDSRVAGTKLLCETLARLEHKPRVLVCASAIGFYGDRGDDLLDEHSAAGAGFLPDVCQQWEAAADPARQAGIRVVHARLGVVLSPRGGALKEMLTPFRIGVGGKLGSGRQYWSWVTLDDVVSAIHQALVDERLSGPVNVVAPEAITNLEFTKTLGRVLSRPTLMPMPAPLARLALGEMADALLLSSARVAPARLREVGFPWRDPELEPALRKLLGRPVRK